MRVVIVGGGFAGLYAARKLGRAPVEVTLVDRRNFHLFQPLLYQVATGGLSPGDIASPLRAVLKRYRNISVLQAEVTGLDPEARRLELGDGSLEYDTLILATGSQPIILVATSGRNTRRVSSGSRTRWTCGGGFSRPLSGLNARRTSASAGR